MAAEVGRDDRVVQVHNLTHLLNHTTSIHDWYLIDHTSEAH